MARLGGPPCLQLEDVPANLEPISSDANLERRAANLGAGEARDRNNLYSFMDIVSWTQFDLRCSTTSSAQLARSTIGHNLLPHAAVATTITYELAGISRTAPSPNPLRRVWVGAIRFG